MNIEKRLETKTFILRKEDTACKTASKAPPLRHLWYQTKGLPKKPKGFNYAKLYRMAREQQEQASNTSA
jgi:hypothetical protein